MCLSPHIISEASNQRSRRLIKLVEGLPRPAMNISHPALRLKYDPEQALTDAQKLSSSRKKKTTKVQKKRSNSNKHKNRLAKL